MTNVFNSPDFIHDFHASLFTAISSWAEENYLDLVAPAMPLWLRANQFLGFSVSMVSLFAVVRALVEELICSCFKREDRRRDPETWIHFKTALNASHITLWCAAAFLCFPILLFSVDLQQFGYGQARKNLTEFSRVITSCPLGFPSEVKKFSSPRPHSPQIRSKCCRTRTFCVPQVLLGSNPPSHPSRSRTRSSGRGPRPCNAC